MEREERIGMKKTLPAIFGAYAKTKNGGFVF
jgi:hypothetical protein